MFALFLGLCALMAVGIYFAININKRRNNSIPLVKTMSFNPNENVPHSQHQHLSLKHSSCSLAIALRVVAALTIVASLVFTGEYETQWLITIPCGVVGALFWLALAKCVDAADHYLKNL